VGTLTIQYYPNGPQIKSFGFNGVVGRCHSLTAFSTGGERAVMNAAATTAKPGLKKPG